VRRTILTLLVVGSLLFQSMASAGQGVLTHAAEGLAHAMLHWEKTAHHHHDDGSYHEDESDQSSRHLQADNALGVLALPSFTPLALTAKAPCAIVVSAVSGLPPPVLDGPTRPPRAAG
jgi:hypothetical protein